MTDSWTCRDYIEGDEHQILALFKEVFGRDMSLAFWRWRFIDNPFGRGIIKLMFDGNKLIGHYAVIPMDLQVQGKLLKAVFSMTTMTHPEYTGKGIFTLLAEATYKTSQEKGYKLVYGFPNRNSQLGFVRKLGWQDLGKMYVLEKELCSAARQKTTKAGYLVQEIPRFDSSINLFWNEVKRHFIVIVPRTSQFLNWRFVNNLETEYQKRLISDKRGNALGYVVLKIYTKEGMIKGHIVDMLSVPCEDVIRLILDYVQDYFLEKGADNISCWIPQNSHYYSLLKAEGYARNESETYFGFRSFSEDAATNKTLKELSNWHLTMGDSDVF